MNSEGNVLSMNRKFGHLLAAATVLAAGLVGVGVPPAGAAVVVSPIVDCSTGPSDVDRMLDNGDVYEITLGGGNCTHVRFDQTSGTGASVTVDLAPVSEATLVAFGQHPYVVVQIPASGSGSIDVALFAGDTSTAYRFVTICYGTFGALTGGLTDDGNGGVTFTYGGDVGACQYNFVAVYPAGTTCTQDGSPLPSQVGLMANSNVWATGTVPPSPATITGGSHVSVAGTGPNDPGTTVPLVGGSTYVFCYYRYDVVNSSTLVQSLTASLGNAAAVTPAYTG